MLQKLLLPAEGLWGSFQTYLIHGLKSPRGAAPWIIAFLAALAYGWELPWEAAHPGPALFISPRWDRQ